MQHHKSLTACGDLCCAVGTRGSWLLLEDARPPTLNKLTKLVGQVVVRHDGSKGTGT